LTLTLEFVDPAWSLVERQRHLRRIAEAVRRVFAERLVLSVRTVDNHLHRIHGKLGITRRDELPGAR
jgi:DNA-binding NarL/FixJ family response regulator